MAPLVLFVLLHTAVEGLQEQNQAPPRLALSEEFTLRSTFSPKDCFQKRAVSRVHVKRHLALEAENATKIPGSGLEEIVPFETVLKDGYMKIACVKDYMFLHGDKFGDNRYSYKLHDVSNVSIVHYSKYVVKEDRKAMSPQVCFDFCRTVPDMHFFGIMNGRECYCETYFKQMAGDSSSCDAVCEGQPTTTCGGKFKSDIFEMHMCANTGEELTKTSEATDEIVRLLEETEGNLTRLYEEGQSGAEELQKVYGQLGDPTAADLFQTAKERAGVLEGRAKSMSKILGQIQNATVKISDFDGVDLTDFATMKKAEELIANIKGLVAEGKKIAKSADSDLELHRAIASKQGQERVLNASQVYYPAMYFIDKIYLTDQATCNGPLVAPPRFGLSVEQCAFACERLPSKCTAFAHYTQGEGMCFLFSKLHKVTHYSDCLHRNTTQKRDAFLQRHSLASADEATYMRRQASATAETVFTWKNKSADPDPDLFNASVAGLCTQCRDCGALTVNATLPDCSLMDTYECKKYEFKNVSDIQDENGVDVIRMEFRGQVETGRRSSACKINPTPCDSCKMYSTCSGPYSISNDINIPKGNVASYTWRSSGAVDNYEVFVGLYSAKGGLVDYQFQRGKSQPWKTFELAAPETDMYYLKFLLASYDGSGGGAVGADMEIKSVTQRPPNSARSATKAMCVVKYADYDGMNLRPDPKGERVGALQEVTKRCLRSGGALEV